MKFERMVKQEVEAKYLLADMGVRYWEDGEVNGVGDNDTSPNMPFAKGEQWRLMIDLETGRIDGWPDGTFASVHYKVCDAGVYYLLDADKEAITQRDGYVPQMLCPKDDGYGDYVIMDIGPDGTIQNWSACLDYFSDSDA